MHLLEDAKKMVEDLAGLGRPSTCDLLVRQRKPRLYRFKDDGLVPNHPKWPLVIYRSPLRLPNNLDPAAVFEVLFERNGWGDFWRGGIYDYLHYHSNIHETLAVAHGTAKVRFGGGKGRTLELVAGDVAIIPAGTGHQCLSASDDFLVVGAYPPTGTYDECRGSKAEHHSARKRIRKVRRPSNDPVFWRGWPLLLAWR
jgi:uncharacterized protein YjlB